MIVEHVIIGLKIVIAILIPDVPKNVKDAETKRKFYEFNAKAEMRTTKEKHKVLDLKQLQK